MQEARRDVGLLSLLDIEYSSEPTQAEKKVTSEHVQ